MPTKKRPSRASRGAQRSTIRRSRVVERGPRGAPADVEVGARLALGGHAQQRAERLAVEEQDALVALRTVGQVALRHRPARAEARRLLEDREQVPVVVAHVEDALAAAPVERLHDHLAAELRRGSRRSSAIGA